MTYLEEIFAAPKQTKHPVPRWAGRGERVGERQGVARMADDIAAVPLGRRRANLNQRLARVQPSGNGSTALKVHRPFRIPEVMLGVLLVAGCALAAVLWNQSNNATSTIVVAARHITRGTAITAEDLRGAEMAGATTAMIGGTEANVLLGQVALVDIEPTAPFTRSLLAATAPLAAEEALTSMALAPGQLPPDLAPSDHVRIVVTAVADATGATATELLVDEATVWSVTTAPDGVATIVTVRGPISLSSQIAAAAKVQLARVEGR